MIDMGSSSSTTKYVIYATIEVDGVVEEPDVIGAIFGQTEGLLGEELDLRELQKNGRIGRIRVKLEIRDGKSHGTIVVPSNLDRVETAIIAAVLESVDKVGPCDAKIRVTKIEDMRVRKRKWIVERAKEILRQWEMETMPETRRIIEEVMKAVRAPEVVKWGPERLPAGPDVDRSDTVIIVEGRADVVNLVKH
ncbi:MAG: DNA primase, partial [Thermoprotei archaeon]